MKYISIDSGKWEDVNRTYRVLQYEQRDNSTAVDLKLELEDLDEKKKKEIIGGKFSWRTNWILEWMFEEGEIPSGNYVVKVSW